MLLILVLSLCSITSHSGAKKILFVPAHEMPSHAKSMDPMVKTLAAVGHDVAFLEFVYEPNGTFRRERKNNLTTLVLPLSKPRITSKEARIMWTLDTSQPWRFTVPWTLASTACREVLTSDHLSKKFMEVSAMRWDLVAVDAFFSPCGMLLAEMNHIPAVAYDTTKTWIWTHKEKGTMWSRSLYYLFRADVPKKSTSSFEERTINLLSMLVLELTMKITYRMLPVWIGLPSAVHLERFYESSLFAISMFPAYMDNEIPQVHDVIHAKMSCPPTPPLDAEYEAFVNDSQSSGTIVLTFGHYLQWELAPVAIFSAFLVAFTRLERYRIVWQCNRRFASRFPIPSHVLVSEWLPQSALLSHPNTVLFISHGGLKSMNEALCASVPIVTLPVFAEQHVNAMMINRWTVGTDLDRHRVTADMVHSAVTSVLANDTFKNNVRRLSAMLRDKPLNDREEELFRFQFFLRHQQRINFIRQKSCSLATVVLYYFDIALLAAVVIGTMSWLLF